MRWIINQRRCRGMTVGKVDQHGENASSITAVFGLRSMTAFQSVEGIKLSFATCNKARKPRDFEQP
jgi:hypothetical protein